MVCISCFIAPVVLFIWYKFIYPYLQPLINRFIGDYQLPQPFSDLACPLPKKSPKSVEEKEKNEAPVECPFKSNNSDQHLKSS